MLETTNLSVKDAQAAARSVTEPKGNPLVEVLGRKDNLPSFRGWRVQNDAIMVPDRGFKKQLQALDPELAVMWDWGKSKWEIWRFPKNGAEPHYVLTVETKDKTYRELGTDVLLRLQQIDMSKYTAKQLIAYFDELDKQVRRRQAKELRDKLQDIRKETENFLFNLTMKPIKINVPKKVRVRRIVANG